MIVTLLTDFGTLDHYVGVMKGVILGLEPAARLVDLTHGIAPGDIRAGAFALLAAYEHFPGGTVHVCVVDPGVGSERRAVAVEIAGQRFVGPDNGLFSYLLEREPGARIVHVTTERFHRRPVSATFHGRDVFAPLGAALAAGTPLEDLGPRIGDPVRLSGLLPRRGRRGTLRGRILHVDRFGNCVTSIRVEDLSGSSDQIRARAGSLEISGLRHHYAGAFPDQPFLIPGSSGFLEISVNGGSAAERGALSVGDECEILAEGSTTGGARGP